MTTTIEATAAGTRRGTRASGPARRWLPVLVMAVAVVLALLAAEAAARVFFPQWAPRTGRVTQFWQYDARYGWAHVPGSTGVFESYGIHAPVTINAKGYRGPDVPYARTPGRPRVVVLGDSYVWGFGVPERDMFTARLQEGIPGLEIVNLGVSGYGTDQELLLYRDEGRRYRADAVMVVVAVNDLASIMERTESVIYGKPHFVLDDQGGLTLENYPVVQTPLFKRVLVRMAWQSYLLTQVHRRLADRSGGPIAALRDEPDRVFPRSDAEKLLVRLLGQMHADVVADGSRLLVVLVDGFGPQGEAIARYLAERGTPSVVLDRTLQDSDPTVHLPDGFHWNAIGHERVARVLADRLADVGIKGES
ncbi:MAG TPA: SGNH/GDSL hydrolase family protein [Nitrospirales bacterium]|nr:SGNH/GDSL hydrolase family protein [Nitrospirales bacterium]